MHRMGSLSGAVIGGLMFGVGMVLVAWVRFTSFGFGLLCGNLRALGDRIGSDAWWRRRPTRAFLAPHARSGFRYLDYLWRRTSATFRRYLGFRQSIYAAMSAVGLFLACRSCCRPSQECRPPARIVIGGRSWISGGTWLVDDILRSLKHPFEVVPVSSVTFTGPATDTLMALVAERNVVFSFGIGLVPGVAIGAAVIGHAIAGEWRIERFGPDTPMERYLVGAVLMGFGAMLAGGCAVGAGLSGGSALSLTAWLAVFFYVGRRGQARTG